MAQKQGKIISSYISSFLNRNMKYFPSLAWIPVLNLSFRGMLQLREQNL